MQEKGGGHWLAPGNHEHKCFWAVNIGLGLPNCTVATMETLSLFHLSNPYLPGQEPIMWKIAWSFWGNSLMQQTFNGAWAFPINNMHLILHFSLSKSKLLHNQSSMQVHLKQVSAYQCAQDNFTNKKPYKFQIPPSNYDSSHSSIIKFDRIQIKTKNAHTTGWSIFTHHTRWSIFAHHIRISIFAYTVTHLNSISWLSQSPLKLKAMTQWTKETKHWILFSLKKKQSQLCIIYPIAIRNS